MTDAENIQQPAVAGRARLVPWVAMLTGGVLIVLGVWCIGVYAREVVEVWNSSDRSMIYWLLFLPALGIALIGIGAYFVVIGWFARRGNPAGTTLARYSLVALAGLVAVAVLAGYVRLQQAAQDRREQEPIVKLRHDRVSHARRVERLELAIAGDRELAVRADLADSLDGRYRMTLTLSSAQAVFHQASRLLHLQGPTDPVIHELALEAVFADCFTTANASRAYVCAKGGSVEEVYTVAVRLELIGDARGAISASELRYDPVASTATAELMIDTETTQDAVIIRNARVL